MTAVEQAISEIDGSLAELEPELEGFRDFSRLDIAAATQGQIKDLIAQYDRRVQLLQAAKDRLTALMADGHPTIPVRVLPTEVYADLATNANTIESALSKVVAQAPATTLGITTGAPEPK